MPAKNEALSNYFDALQRLVDGTALQFPPNTKITLRAVSVEAGLSPGSIKRTRPIYAKLIEMVEHQAAKQAEQRQPKVTIRNQIQKHRLEREHYERLYKESLGRELMLLYQLDKMEILLHSAENIVPFPRPDADEKR